MSTFNVFRYSALGAGIFYGFYHRETLKSIAKKQEATEKYQKTEKLILEAKDEFAKLHTKKGDSESSNTTDLSKINLDDKNLDFAKIILGSVETLK